MSFSLGSLLRGVVQTLSGQNAEAAEESTGASQPGAESRRQAPAPAAAGGSPLGPADQQRDGHAQRQRRLDDMLAEASRAPLPLVASNEQQDVEQQVPASLTVTVCDKPGTPMAATFTERHVADLLELLRSRELFEPLRLGREGGITAADFYAACATSVTGHGRRVGFDFVVDGPPTHRLLRLELLAARAGRAGFAERLNPNPFNEIKYAKCSSALSNGAARLFAHLWQHGNQGRQQKVLCEDLASGREGGTGASAGGLDNILRSAYKEVYNSTPSKAPKTTLTAVEEHQPAALDPLLAGPDEDAQLLAGAGQLPEGQLQQQELAAVAAVPPAALNAQPADQQALIAVLQEQLYMLSVQVEALRNRVAVLELRVPTGV